MALFRSRSWPTPGIAGRDRRNIAVALDGIIFAQRMAFPVVGKQNTPQIGMSGELNPEHVENLALEPIRALPYGNERIDDGIVNAQLDADAQLLPQRDRNQLIVQFKARFHRIAVESGSIGEEVEFQLFGVATLFGNATQHFARHDDRRIAPIFNDFLDRVGAPRAELRDYTISSLTTTVRHSFRIPACADRYLCQSNAR